jgi:AAA15 family ATPase/GTPase
MLIEFRVANFRSFWKEQTLSMVATSHDKQLVENTFDPGIVRFDRLLRSAMVYGPNASGKTNLLRALQFVQGLVLNSARSTTSSLPYSPFKFAVDARQRPSEFEVTFVQNGIRYEYGFVMGPERIEEEWLIEHVHVRGRTMFERRWDARKRKYNWRYSEFLKGQRAVWSEATRPDALFLSTAIQLNSEQLRPVFEWFQRRLVVIAGVSTLNPTLTLRLLSQPSGKERLLPFLREADDRIADLDVSREQIPAGAIVVQGPSNMIEHGADGPPSLVRVTFSHLINGQDQLVPLDFSDESSGTQVLFRTAGAWLNVFDNGEVLLFDEIDTSLHPLLTRFLIQRFHSSISNPNNAQILFTTHNTSHLDQRYFRRDQIWFVEKDQDGASRLYPLTEFRPRSDEKLESWYMRGRYGALPILTDAEL